MKEEKKKGNFSWGRLIQSLIRWGLMIFLGYNIYGETGVWTTIALALVFIGFEVQSVLNTIHIKSLSGFAEKVLDGFEVRDKMFKKKSPKDLMNDELDRRARDN